jgi:adenine C2-methylase RlmN of 23S rRNA A2503 and tRNA A37
MQVRNWIMPINRKYNLGLLLQTLREELGLKNSYKVLFEYVMLEGVNDRLDWPFFLCIFFSCEYYCFVQPMMCKCSILI